MLWDFLKAGFIKPIPFSESKGPWKDVALDGVAYHPAGAIIEYKFAFETVYEEIYQSLSASIREKTHLKIARILHAIGISKSVASNEIEICKHYNLAIDIVSDQEEMKLISSLNLQAAELAMSDFDFDSAKAFLTKGIAILNELGQPWLPTDSLYFNLNLQMAKCLIVDGDLMDARHVLKTMETHSHSKCHIYKVFYLQRHLDAMFGDFKAVLEEGRSNLRDLGIHIPTTSEGCKKLALEHFQFCQSTLENKSVTDVIASVRMADEESDMIQAIILIVSFAAYRSATKPLFSMLIAMGCHKSLVDGFGRSSCALWMAYPCLSFYLLEQPSFKSIDTSQMMADAVTQFFPDKSQEFEIIYKILCGHTLLLSNSQAVEMIEALIQNARHSGHNLTMNTLSLHLISSGFAYGRSISWLRSHLASQREILLASNSQSVAMIDHLMQRVESIVSGEPVQSVDEPLIHVFDIIQAMIYDKPELHLLLSNARAGDRCLPVVKLIELMFFDCILLANQYHGADKDRDSIRIKLNETVNAMKCYMARGFVDAVGKRSLMLAELERINENVVAAIAHYEAAIEEFKQTGSLLFEAFALERFAAMFHGNGMKKMAQMCFTECVKKWTEYGSEGKRVHVIGKFKSLYGSAEAAIFDAVCRMNQKPVTESGFSYTITRKGSISPSNSSNSRSFCHSSRFGDSQTTNGTVNLDIDVTTTLKVAQSIREETSLDSLLRKIMRYVMVNTGATKGALVLNDTSRLMIEAIAEFSENQESIDVLQSHPITTQVHGYRLPLSVIYYAFRTRKSLVLTDPTNDPTHGNDTYIKEFRPQSILCCPIINQSTVTGVVYLENKLQGAAFTPKRIEIIQALMPTASVYIKNAKLTKTNTELTEALKDSGNAPNVPKYKIDAPVQRAIDVLQSLKSRMTAQGDPAVRQIDFIMMSLTSSDLFMSSIDEINDENGRGIDQDTKNWIENSLLQKSSKPSRGPENDGEAMFVVGNRRPTVVSVPEEGSHESLNVGSGSPRILPRALVQNNEEINLFLEGFMDYDFDVFRLGELTNGQPLYYLSMHLLQYYGLIEHFNIDIEVAKTFFREVEANYRNLSYHNSYHAADVLQTVNLLLLSDPQMAQNFTKLEILAACIASAVHDVDHPGVNNNYLIQSSHPLAILYNDLSVLEYHHASKAFEIMQKPQTNIFAKFPADQKRDVRKQMINMVIATDMSQHFTYINKLKSKISAAALKLQEAADRALVLDMAIKCADLNNPAKSLESCKSWCYRIMEEFFQQGDRERLNGLNVSMFMDRKDTNIPKCQIGFIDILVAPLFESWSQCIATDFTRICMKNISLNRSHWESILDKPDAIPAFQPPDLHLLEQELFTTVGSPATLKKKLISMQKGGTEYTSDSFRQRSKTSSIAGKNARTSPIPNKSNALSSSKNYPKQGFRVDGKSQAILAKGDGSIEDVSRNYSGKADARGQATPITPKMGRRTSAVVEMINPIKPSAIGFNLPELPKSDNSTNALNTSNNE
ncbi:High affinity cAMP-specific 3',5'-cyclic phosphodiesterase 7A [Chytriomyces hyalinus]|nr:High affinity cAMP-specific 3',5'-cyclic phosphodiesterase 7A [Chytriomyces hyalinus]